MTSSNVFASPKHENRKPRRLDQLAFFACTLAVASLFFVPTHLSAQTTGTSSAASHSPGWVVLSITDYRSLHAKAYPPDHEPVGPPVDATLTRLDYDLRIDGDLASGRATLTVDVLKDGWVRVPIPAGLLVREAKLDGKLVSLVPAPNAKVANELTALLSKPGRSILQLDIALPVAPNSGDEVLTLPPSSSGVMRATVHLPKQGMDVKLIGGFFAEKSEASNESKWLAYGYGNQPLMFTWKRKTEDHRSTQPLRLRGSLTELAGLGEDATTVAAEVKVEVTQGAAKEVRIVLPEKVTINQVSGATVADWEMKDGQLVVTFLEPVEQRAQFIVSGETRSPRDGLINIPLLRLMNVERDSGGVAVEVLGAGEIKESKTEGLENADASDLGEVVASRQSTSLSAFRYHSGDAKTKRSLTVNIARYTTQAVLMANVAEARYNVLITNEGKLLVQARYAVRNNSRNFLKITLPQGATLWSASLAGKPIRPGQSPDGGVLLPLEKSHAGEEAPEFAVEVVYIGRGNVWNDKGQFKLSLPALDLPISRTGLLVYHPPLFKVTPENGSFHIKEYEEPLSAALNPPPPPAPPPPMPMRASSPAPSSSSMLTLSTGASVAENMAMADQSTTQSLVDNFHATLQGGKAAGILPIKLSFPALGPSLYLVSELTGENQSPSADLSYQREKKAGGR